MLIDWKTQELYFRDPCIHQQTPAMVSGVLHKDLLGLPIEYEDFQDVFEERGSNTLSLHQPYHCGIELILGAPLPIKRQYSFMEPKEQALQDFLGKNVRHFLGFVGFSHISTLFVKKKSLYRSQHLQRTATASRRQVDDSEEFEVARILDS
uniref:Uncharacterized protein n=1 Tax=Sphaerodactylus townsendi TaxID=933632 RepID=A0ACB8F7V6_9SAUR